MAIRVAPQFQHIFLFFFLIISIAPIFFFFFLAGYLAAPVASGSADDFVVLPGQPGGVDVQQYAGYVTVAKDRALFYYFVEARQDPEEKPLVLWLHGGPGCSSLGGGAFVEHGPFKPKGDVLVHNEHSWNKVANMLYVESPAGVGFSYSTGPSFYHFVTDDITAWDNLAFLLSWFEKFPAYKGRDFFITGESYAGHFVPQLAVLILNSTEINLKGVAMGNPLLDFSTDFNSRAQFFWSHGLISDETFEAFTKVCNYSEMQRQLNRQISLSTVCQKVNDQVFGEISASIDTFDVTLDLCTSPFVSGGQFPKEKEKVDVCIGVETINYLNRQDVQHALHAKLVGVSSWTLCSVVAHYHYPDTEIPTLPLLGKLVGSGIRVLVYSGDQDSVIPLIGTRILVHGLSEELGLSTTVPYSAWFQGKQVGGWTRVYGDLLQFATIRGGSHEAAFSQPERALQLFESFIVGKPLPAQSTQA